MNFYFLYLIPKVFHASVAVNLICDILERVAEHQLLIPFVHLVFIAQSVERVPAVVGRMLLDADTLKSCIHVIVCAGVTALMQTLIRSIEDLTEDKIKYEISSGRTDIKYKNLSEKAKTLVDSFFVGICAIANEFPENVRIM